MVLAISGFYPPGSAGNEHATVIEEWVGEKLRESPPAAVLFDLTGLDYVWGDALWGIARPLFRGRDRPLPAAWLAIGPTAKALESLIAAVFRGEMQLFEDRGDALRFLEAHTPRVRP